MDLSAITRVLTSARDTLRRCAAGLDAPGDAEHAAERIDRAIDQLRDR